MKHKGKNQLSLEGAVHAARIYHGSESYTSIRNQQRLYTKMMQAIARAARTLEMDETSVAIEIGAEAARRGPIRPIPGKDF